MGQIATLSPTHFELPVQIQAVRDRVNAAGVSLRLYLEDEDYNPLKVLASAYTEAVFTGYAPVDLEGEWTAAAIDFPGTYSIEAGEYDFALSAGADELVHGAFIETAGNVLFAGRLPVAFNFHLGEAPLRLRLLIFQIASLVHAQIVLA